MPVTFNTTKVVEYHMLPNRAAALIFKNKKLLLVTGYDEAFYWTPGGKVETKESVEEGLIRELKEELQIVPTTITPYARFITPNENNGKEKMSHYFMVTYKGKLTLSKEITNMMWYSKEDFQKQVPRVTTGMREKLIPKLIAEGYL